MPGLLHAWCVLQKQGGQSLSFCKQDLTLYSRAEWASGIYPSLLCLRMHTVCRMWQIWEYRILQLPQQAMIPCGLMGNVGTLHGRSPVKARPHGEGRHCTWMGLLRMTAEPCNKDTQMPPEPGGITEF